MVNLKHNLAIKLKTDGRYMCAPSDKTILAPGDVLEQKWEIIEHIATGGMGEIYKARQLKLGREVAIKVISQDLIDAHDDDRDEIQTEIDRFRREMLAMARLRHPNVLQIYDFEESILERNGCKRPLEYIVMEYIPGPHLGSTIPDGGLREDPEALHNWIRRYFQPVLDGVEFIHKQDIIHRDLKPANVLLDGEVPKLADFGLAGGGPWQKVTRSHHVMGTLAYMAPEQYLDLAEADARADVYSLGKILYNAIVGRLGKESMLPLKTAKLDASDTPFLKDLDRVIQQSTAEDHDKRLPSVKALRQEIEKALATANPPNGQVERHSRGIKVISLVALGLAGLLAVGTWHHFRGGPFGKPAIESLQTDGQPPKTATQAIGEVKGPLQKVIKGRDGVNLHLVPAGTVQINSSASDLQGPKIKVAAFYMDEIEVTNHQYVWFLNRNLSQVKVADGVVKGKGRVWLQLGEIKKGYEPIVYEQGRFNIKNPSMAANPVVGVSAYGAAAYAAFVNRRLPSRAEWLRAAAGQIDSRPVPAAPEKGRGQRPWGSWRPRENWGAWESRGEMMRAGQPGPASLPQPKTDPEENSFIPVSQDKPNMFGIKGLHREGIGEWTAPRNSSYVKKDRPHKFFIMDWPRNDNIPNFQIRNPWEVFEWVGFRCASNTPKPNTK